MTANLKVSKKNSSTLWSRFSTLRELGIGVVTLVLIILVTFRSNAFLTVDNFRDIFMAIALTIIVACGQMMVIIIRGIDLSVGSVVGLVGMTVGMMIRDQMNFFMPFTVIIGIGLGFLLGAINGLIITKGKVPPIVATLGTMSIYRGLVVVVSNGQWVDTYRIPAAFLQITRMPIFGVPALIIYAIIIAIGTAIFLKYSRIGRQIFALGSNPNAAEVAGIPTDRVKFIVFCISGTLAGFAAVLWASRFGSVVNDMGAGFELQTVAACVVGGVSVLGGAGSILGVVMGALLIGIIGNALTISNINPFLRLTVNGILILLAVVFDTYIYRRLGKSK